MCLKNILFACLLFLGMASLSRGLSAEVSLIVQDTVVKNAQWSNPSDGKLPEILFFEVSFKIDNVHSMSVVVEKMDNVGYLPLEYIQNGDQIEIIDEKFAITKEGWSWFKIRNLQKNIAFEAVGNSIKKKIIPPADDTSIVFAEDVRVKFVDEVKFAVSFAIKGVYVSMKTDTPRFHGFYNKKPFSLQHQAIVPTNIEGEYLIIFTLKDLETDQIFEATSLPINDSLNLTVTAMSPFDIELDFRGGSRVALGFKVSYTFQGEGGYHTAKIGGSSALWSKYFDPSGYAKKRREEHGNDFVILEEIPDPADRRFSSFIISSTKSGEVLHLHGPARKSKLQ